MASGQLLGGGDGNNGNNDGAASREKHRWADTGKVYTRKSFNKSKPSQNPNPQPPPSAAAAVDQIPPPPPPPPSHASSDDSSSLNPKSNGLPRFMSISLSSKSKNEVRELRRKLTTELEQVRALSRKFEQNHSTNFSARRELSVVVPTEVTEKEKEKEKRTPKANQYYRNSEFLLGKDKLPPSDSHHSHKKSKPNGSGKIGVVDSKVYSQAFKCCANLLSKLMKHTHGWVFNTPVDVKALGLHDYYSIIKQPMDLGTVKTRLSKNWYKTPDEFAEDVRLTFRNAMIYNPKGQDVHIMAERLLQLFEENWPSIEAEYTYLLSPKPAAPPLPVPPLPSVSAKRPPSIDMKKVLERSVSMEQPMSVNSMAQPVSVNSKTSSKPLSYTPHIGRPSVLKKPKAKDLHKRDMTFEEKQKLSNNLQNLPPEKLDNVVQIIKKRNSMLSQHDDEIEVDIDSVDTETLWELDRFVMNYKKSLSKNKRKAELAVLARAEGHHEHAEKEQEQEQETVQEKNSEPVLTEMPREIRTVVDEKEVASSPKGGEKKVDNASRSSSSRSSGSDSGSSSTDSDSESSSAGSDAAQSPRA